MAKSLDNLTLPQKLTSLLQLVLERLIIVFKTKSVQEAQVSFSLIAEFIRANFNNKEKLTTVIGLFAFFILGNFLIDLVTFREIDNALVNQQSARAESMIQRRLVFLPGNTGLQLRLAHAYLGLDRDKQAKAIIERAQKKDPHNPYLVKVGLALSQKLKGQGRAYEALSVLDKIPPNLCKECRLELLDLYTLEGRKSLIGRNLERANFYLSQSLILAEKLQESNSSINNRKRELARTYNLQASQLVKAEENDRAIGVLEKSISIYPIGQTYLMLAKLYTKRQAGIPDLKKALDSFEKAYSFGFTEPEYIVEFNKTLGKLKKALKAQGSSDEEIERETKGFSLTNIELKNIAALASTAKKEAAEQNNPTNNEENNKDENENEEETPKPIKKQIFVETKETTNEKLKRVSPYSDDKSIQTKTNEDSLEVE